jgi:hypothetical protein
MMIAKKKYGMTSGMSTSIEIIPPTLGGEVTS